MKRDNCAHPQYAVQQVQPTNKLAPEHKQFRHFCTLCGANAWETPENGLMWTSSPTAMHAEVRRAGVLELEV